MYFQWGFASHFTWRVLLYVIGDSLSVYSFEAVFFLAEGDFVILKIVGDGVFVLDVCRVSHDSGRFLPFLDKPVVGVLWSVH